MQLSKRGHCEDAVNKATHDTMATAPPRDPPVWLRRGIERVPGAVRVDHALMRSLETYGGEWRRLLPRALAAYIPGGLIVLLAAQFLSIEAGVAVNFLVLFLGVVLLQSAEVARVAAGPHGESPYLRTLWRIRGRLGTLLAALLLVLLMMYPPAIVFGVASLFVIFGSIHCTVSSASVTTCSVNLLPYFVLTAIFILTLLPLGVRWIVMVPVVTLERRGP